VSPKNGASRFGLWLSIVISAFGLIALLGSVFYVGFSTKANSDSIDRQLAINDKTQAQFELLRGRIQAQESALVEIETQFCAQDNILSERHARDLRDFAVVYEKVFGSPFPIGNAFYGGVCVRKANASAMPR
jgi:hypothetical protein